MEEIKALLEKIGNTPEQISVDMVFGEPQVYAEYTLIPVAEISYGFGAGVGIAEGAGQTAAEPQETAESEEAAAAEEEKKGGSAGGGGGGAAAKARPLAYIEIGPEGTRVRPIQDEQKIDLAGILLVAWIFGWMGLVLKSIFDN